MPSLIATLFGYDAKRFMLKWQRAVITGEGRNRRRATFSAAAVAARPATISLFPAPILKTNGLFPPSLPHGETGGRAGGLQSTDYDGRPNDRPKGPVSVLLTQTWRFSVSASPSSYLTRSICGEGRKEGRRRLLSSSQARSLPRSLFRSN